MPKARTVYVCNECGAESSQHFGRCPVCSSWNSLVEQVAPEPAASSMTNVRSRVARKPDSAPQPRLAQTLDQVQDHPQARLSSGYHELDRVLGGGIVPGSLTLVGGDPGIGKSTLLLQVANQLARFFPVLYVCAEESGQQVKLRSSALRHWAGERRHNARTRRNTRDPKR
ncbi:MAG: AAA family ATPase, partial [Leptolyngbyaceae cyanobacterium SL_1_1]|nr:AAA family ATPase [Leptolyngbyaceae cyanobacterium SL_1_1]